MSGPVPRPLPVPDPGELAGLRTLVTGGTRGIGASVAARLAAGGADVVVTARHATDDLPAGVRAVTGDLTTREGVDAVAGHALELLGGADALVNNVGGFVLHPDGLASVPDEEWTEMLELNFLSAVRMDRALLPHLIASKGVIVEMSSVSARTPAVQTLTYAAAKAALTTYAKGLARAVGPQGVRVNSLAPGGVDTAPWEEMVDTVAEAGAMERSDAFALVVGDVPLGGPGRPQDVAEAVAFLVSGRSRWMTGSHVTLDGGSEPAVH